MGVGGQRHALAALTPVKTRYRLYRKMGGPQGRYGRMRKISPPPGFDPRNVQPVASRYTDWAITAHGYSKNQSYKFREPQFLYYSAFVWSVNAGINLNIQWTHSHVLYVRNRLKSRVN
jgi:hypothetical protein